MKIADKYVPQQIESGWYDYWIENLYDGEVMVIDKDHEDFVDSPEVMERICRRLDEIRAKDGR